MSAGKTEGRVERRGGARKPAKDRDPNDVQFINSLARGLQVLVAISDNPEGLGNSEIAQQVNLPNPTVSRITHTLTSQGYLLYAPRMGKYRLGPMVLAIWRGYMIGMKVAGVARPLMREFARQTRSIVTLGERCRLHIVYVEVQREFSTAVLEQEIGTQMPLAFSANGWAWLAGRLKSLRTGVMAELETSLGADWPRWAETIEAARRQVERVGFCTNIGHWQPEINGASTPIVSPDGQGIFSLTCGGPSFAFDVTRLTEDIGPRLAALKRTVQAQCVERGIWAA